MPGGNYNRRPEGWQQLDARDFFLGYFMHYTLRPDVFRQLYYDESDSNSGLMSARLFDIGYGTSGLGLAIGWDFKANGGNGEPAYFKYGDPEVWKKFRGEFAAQFSGDNT